MENVDQAIIYLFCTPANNLFCRFPETIEVVLIIKYIVSAFYYHADTFKDGVRPCFACVQGWF